MTSWWLGAILLLDLGTYSCRISADAFQFRLTESRCGRENNDISVLTSGIPDLVVLVCLGFVV